MKKKGLVLAGLLLLTAGVFAGCSKKESNTFTVGFDANFPPYGYTDESGAYVGFDLDLAAEVAKRNGWEIKLQAIDWDSKDMELSSGSIDCIWNGFTMSEERIDKYEWTTPYVDNSQVFVVKKDSGITTQADLAGKIVAVQADSSALEALNSDECSELLASFSELVTVPDYNTAFMNLEAGAVEAIAMDIGVAKYQNSARDDQFLILDEELVSELYGVGFLKGNTELRDKVQTSLNEMAADGTLDQIAEKWSLTDSVVLGETE
ncbi:MAG: amino acid ABC transporter substrate-binding protein [Clostridia bacterium]|nr:amino acid ABC transporter substrate-binding protein [Clostridia bacterium]